MDRSQVWRHIHRERADLAATLSSLEPGLWTTESSCPGWTVHDVAAHVISNPQIQWSTMPGMAARNLGRGYNAMIFREVRRLGATETRESILADFETFATSTRHVPITTVIEPLVDALVHHQDIVRPLGLSHEMHPAAAAVAADRCRLLSRLMGSRRVVRSVRMVATDIDWVRGHGPTVEAPMQELLMVCAGRQADPALVTGDGAASLGRR